MKANKKATSFKIDWAKCVVSLLFAFLSSTAYEYFDYGRIQLSGLYVIRSILLFGLFYLLFGVCERVLSRKRVARGFIG